MSFKSKEEAYKVASNSRRWKCVRIQQRKIKNLIKKGRLEYKCRQASDIKIDFKKSCEELNTLLGFTEKDTQRSIRDSRIKKE